MPRAKSSAFASTRVDKLLEQLGDIPAGRVLFDPQPGRATERDLVRAQAMEGSLFELVDGTLVEKAVGWRESLLASWLSHQIQSYLDNNDIGVVTGEGGSVKLLGGLVRMPDVAFTARRRLPGGEPPEEPIPDLVPDLAVEVLSESNTPREMERKLKEYFVAGVTTVWYVDPKNAGW